MNRSRRWRNAFGATLLATMHLALVPVATADPVDATPVDPVSGEPAPPAPGPAVPLGEPVSPDSMDAVSSACRQFGAALDLAASNYEDFAYATAGSGNAVDYQNPNVWESNVIGRTALREAARTALDAAATPGLPPDVANAMKAWSLRATKLLVIMGLRGGGDSLNSAANDLNTDANDVQMACALNGSRA